MHILTVPNQKATANYVPAAAGNTWWQALSGIIGVKRVGGFKSDVKAHGSTVEGHWKLENLSAEEESGIPCAAVKCAEIWRNTSGEGDFLVCN